MYITTIECENDTYDIKTNGKVNIFEKDSLLYVQDEKGEEIFAVNIIQLVAVDLNNEIEGEEEDEEEAITKCLYMGWL